MRVGLLFGGRSVEHEVSVASARGVSAALRAGRHECVPIAVDGNGRWLAPERSAEMLDGDSPRVPDADGEVTLALEPGRAYLTAPGRVGAPCSPPIDVVFPLVHGRGGEDGRLQGALELVGVPYVGSGVLGSAVAMDKGFARRICDANELPSVAWLDFDGHTWRQRSERCLERIRDRLRWPVFVKPANGGSSVGVSRVSADDELAPAIDAALACDRRVIVEQGIDAREIECALLGNDEPQVSVPGEITPSGEFYDYDAKYVDGTSTLQIPAQLSAAQTRLVRELAARAYRALDLAGFARIDFLLDRGDDTFYLNEANSLPGFTTVSMFPRLWEASGMPYPELIERLVALALERHRAADRLRSRSSD